MRRKLETLVQGSPVFSIPGLGGKGFVLTGRQLDVFGGEGSFASCTQTQDMEAMETTQRLRTLSALLEGPDFDSRHRVRFFTTASNSSSGGDPTTSLASQAPPHKWHTHRETHVYTHKLKKNDTFSLCDFRAVTQPLWAFEGEKGSRAPSAF